MHMVKTTAMRMIKRQLFVVLSFLSEMAHRTKHGAGTD